jgi:hypothetical protein
MKKPRSHTTSDNAMSDILHFDSIGALRAFAARPTPANRNVYARFNSNVCAVERGGNAWFGVDTYSDVQMLLNTGWPNGVARMLEALQGIAAPQAATSIKRRKTRGDHGDEFDWQAAAQGMTDIAWTRPVLRQIAASRTVTLFCDLTHGSTYMTGAEQFFWRGAAMLYLADSLSAAGYNVRIIGAVRQRLLTALSPIRQFNVQIKQPDMPVDLNSLASSLCLAGFTRTLIFSAICASEPHPLPEELSCSLEAVSEPGEFRVYANDQDSAKTAVQQTLAAINNN